MRFCDIFVKIFLFLISVLYYNILCKIILVKLGGK